MLITLYKWLIWIEGLYCLLTAAWPLLHINSFMAVTGLKTDIWLVKTVSLLILAIAVFLLLQMIHPCPIVPVASLMLTMSAGLAFVDFYYSAQGRISEIYLADGVLQIIFFTAWIYLLVNKGKLEQDLGIDKDAHD